jgi:hypothetical protein
LKHVETFTDSGGAKTRVSLNENAGNGGLLIVNRIEDVEPLLIAMKNARDEEERIGRHRYRDDTMNLYHVAEIPGTIIMEIAKKHGIYWGMNPHLSGCADRAELRKKFFRLIDTHYPQYKSTNKRLA